jgi:hypothetical protein
MDSKEIETEKPVLDKIKEEYKSKESMIETIRKWKMEMEIYEMTTLP